MKFLLLCHFCSRGKQQIHEQIQKRLEDKSMQEEVQKVERQQELEKQEKANLDELKVPPIKRSPRLQNPSELGSQSDEKQTQMLRATCNRLHRPVTPSCVLPGPGEEEGGATARARGKHAHQC